VVADDHQPGSGGKPRRLSIFDVHRGYVSLRPRKLPTVSVQEQARSFERLRVKTIGQRFVVVPYRSALSSHARAAADNKSLNLKLSSQMP
jgi:hypothetical protein